MLEERSTGNPYATFGEGWGAGFPSSPRLLCLFILARALDQCPHAKRSSGCLGNMDKIVQGESGRYRKTD